MRLTKNITFNGSDLTVKELTMAELAGVLDTLAATADPLDMVMDHRLPSEAVIISSGLKRAALHKLTPSLLNELWQAVEEVNPFFVNAVRRLTAADSNDQPPAPPAPSSGKPSPP